MNPFIYNEPVRDLDFINREDIINDLLTETIRGKSHGNVWLTGERQIGKSSLLQYIECECAKQKDFIQVYGVSEKFKTFYVYTNVQDCNSREKFYGNLRQTLKDRFDFKLKNTPDVFNAFKEAMKYCYENRYYILFLIDEFDAFIQNLINTDQNNTIVFLGELNKIASGLEGIAGTPKVFSLILTANNTYADLIKQIPASRDSGSGLITIHKSLDSFSETQVKNLVQVYLKGNPIRFTAAEIALCYKLTKGYPFFVQRLCFVLYQLKSKQTPPKTILNELKEKYKLILKETISSWGGDKMAEKTKHKLAALSTELLQTLGKEAVSAIFGILLKKIP